MIGKSFSGNMTSWLTDCRDRTGLTINIAKSMDCSRSMIGIHWRDLDTRSKRQRIKGQKDMRRTNRFEYYNPNPSKWQRVGDCTVRALCKALGQDWDTVYVGLSVYGFSLSDMPSANRVWGAYLRENGFRRYIVDDHGQHVYTVDDFCRDHPTGTYVLGIDGHVVCVKDGHYWDTWDSGQEIPIYYWER